MEVCSREAVILKRMVCGGASSLSAYRAEGGYAALERSRAGSPEEVLGAVEVSGVRGRGGAGFPTGRKWRAVAGQPQGPKFVVANADEGDPAAYIDRFILEDDPHALIEGMALAAHAVGAGRGFIYLRKEYPKAGRILQAALAEARGGGWLDARFDIELAVGHGSYVCGEETALLNSLEGRRPEVRPRPPYPTARGLHGQPTLINNVETFAAIPWIAARGGAAYHAMGFSNSRGTKVVSLNSLFHRPGLYEIEFGMTLNDIVEKLGGGLKTGPAKGLIVGGPLAGVIPPALFHTPFGFEELRAIGAMVGHGGILAFDEHTSIPELLRHIAAFAARESCGKCTPCRCGSHRLEEILAQPPSGGTQSEWDEIRTALLAASLCGLGTGLGELADTAWRYYRKELEPCFA